jgi:aminoglycoside phosphotransferase (APT) family kinase protein
VTASVFARLICAQFPELAPVHLTLLGEGLDNTAWCVNQRWIFRFPKSDSAVAGIVIERQYLRQIAAGVPLPIPVPQFLGRPGDGFDWPFNGYQLIAGKSAAGMANRASLARPLGTFLAALHRIPVPEWNRTVARIDVMARAERARADLEAVRNVVDPRDDLRALLARLSHPAEPDRTCVLVHGDMHARHLLVNDHGELTGIIDWSGLYVGDPARDLSIGWAFLPPEARADFWTSCGPVSTETLRLARFRALAHELAVVRWALAQRDDTLVGEAVIAFSHLAAD